MESTAVEMATFRLGAFFRMSEGSAMEIEAMSSDADNFSLNEIRRLSFNFSFVLVES
jgi:hypothetical protein